MLVMYCVFATPYQSKEVKKTASYLMIGVTLCLQCWLMPNVYKLLKILQQNSVIYILVEMIKPLWNSHCKVRISLNIGPFVWYNFDFTLFFLHVTIIVQIILFLSQNESSSSDVPNSENNSLRVDGGIATVIPFISPSILSVSLYFNLIYFWLLGLW